MAQIHRRPNDIALVWRQAQLSYRERGRLAGAVRSRVEQFGLAPSAPVGVPAKSSNAVALILGLLADVRPTLLPATSLPGSTINAGAGTVPLRAESAAGEDQV